MSEQIRNGKKPAKGIAPNVESDALYNDKRKIFLFGSPSYTNIGDQAIAYAEEKFIRNHFLITNTLKSWTTRRMTALNL